MLIIDAITKTYPGADRPVFTDVSLSLNAGEALALTGESGGGKSTLLHLAAALDTFDSGDIRFNDQPYSSLNDRGRAELRRSKIALVFQQFNLIPALSVQQNIDFHAKLAGRYDAGWCDTLLERLGLNDHRAQFPENLSGGQQQRVAIGRALAMRPQLLLADEPTGNLDETASGAVMSLMLDLVAESGTALFLVTHSEQVASLIGNRRHLAGGTLQ